MDQEVARSKRTERSLALASRRKRDSKGGEGLLLSLWGFIPGHSKEVCESAPGLECKWRISCFLSRRKRASAHFL